MPYNGSGTFNRLYSWVQDAANGIKIRADRMDNEMNGMATALSDCVTRDGQSPATANLPMGGFGHTNVLDGFDLAMYSSIDQVIQMTYNFCAISGSATVIVANGSIPINAYADNQEISFIAGSDSVAGGTTINRDGVGAVTVQRGGVAIKVGDWHAGNLVILRYDGTHFQTIAPSANPDLTQLDASWITTGTLASARGGAGVVNGLLKANGSGVTSQAVANTDYLPSVNPTATGVFTAPDLGTWTASGIKGLVGLGIGFTGALATAIDVRDNTNNGPTISRVQNTNAGASVSSRCRADNGTYVADLLMFGTGWTTSGISRANGAMLYTDGVGGLTVGTTSNSALYFIMNGAQRGAFATDGSLVVGTNTGAGVGSIRCGGVLFSETNIQSVGEITGFVSDMRLKEHIRPLDHALDKVMRLEGFTYELNDLARELGVKEPGRHLGLSAQLMKLVQPELVVPSGVKGYDTIRYDKIIPLLIEAIKELTNEVRK